MDSDFLTVVIFAVFWFLPLGTTPLALTALANRWWRNKKDESYRRMNKSLLLWRLSFGLIALNAVGFIWAAWVVMSDLPHFNLSRYYDVAWLVPFVCCGLGMAAWVGVCLWERP